ncbi:MAG: beta-lactamase family protein [Acidobacteria bacterium]|jgi:CubicO group peptidase (beta-lactamase class C family)|nr:beta-lactamase family protein [Acidobacteriota bacterium]
MTNKLKQQNIQLRLWFSIINAAVILTVFFQSVSAQNVDVKKLADDLEPEIRRAMIEGNIPSATIALVAGDKVIWTGAYGESNLRARTPATISTVYLIGSTFKAMSTVALLQQMEKGKFKLDDSVSQYLDFKIQNEDPKNPVTFRHLLTHTSGLEGDFGAVPVWSNAAPTALDEYVRKSLKVAHPPMTKVEYSNPAFTLIGYLVEKFSGVPYRQYIKENIFKPLEMTSTEFDPTPDMDERLSVPYVVNKETGKQEPTVRIRAAVYPAGIVYGTILDQSNWLILNLNGGIFKGKHIISEATLNQMMTRQFDQFKGGIEGIWGNETAGFGLTWWSQVRDGDRYFAHSGSLAGYTAFLLGNRDRKLGFAILTNGNKAHPHLFKLADRAMDLMKKYSDTAKTAVVSSAKMETNK